MPAPVSRITIHHEGAGQPADTTRYSEGGYSIGIGVTMFYTFRDPWSSWGTYGYNHQSLDVCLSGNRMEYPVTSSDIDLIRAAVTDARTRAWVTGAPEVVAHKNSPGSSTVCPGDHTMAVWDQVVAACTAGPAPSPTPPSTSEAPLTTVASPHSRNGRQGTARPVPAFGTVQLDNGASCQNDVASGNSRVWVNHDKIVQDTKAPLLDICATVTRGVPDGHGFVALYDLGNGNIGTYVVPWS